MPITHLIKIDANNETKFDYTDFVTGEPADPYQVVRGHQLSWIVLSRGKPIGYRVEFGPKNGSPFSVKSVTVPAGGISPPQPVVYVPPAAGNRSIGYTVTLNDLRSDDPQVVPYDSFLLGELVTRGIPPLTTITITVDARNNVIIVGDGSGSI